MNVKECCSSPLLPDEEAKQTILAVVACPRCSLPGRPVKSVTLKHMVCPQYLDVADKPGFMFCRSAECDVVYFHPDGDVFRQADIRVSVGLKDARRNSPLCYCFGFTRQMVEDEIGATGHCLIAQRIAREVKAGTCACEVRNPEGACCLGDVRQAIANALAQTG